MEAVLAAAGLMFAVLGILFGVWYPEVAATIELDTDVHRLDSDPQQKQVRGSSTPGLAAGDWLNRPHGSAITGSGEGDPHFY